MDHLTTGQKTTGQSPAAYLNQINSLYCMAWQDIRYRDVSELKQIFADQSNFICPLESCQKSFESEKQLRDHIFNGRWTDVKHLKLAKTLRHKKQESFIVKAKHSCPVCNNRFLRCLMQHFNFSKDSAHQRFLNVTRMKIVDLFLKGNSPADIEKMSSMQFNSKYIWRVCLEILGTKRAHEVSGTILGRKISAHWANMPEDKRKKIMKDVRLHEWGHLTPEQRKKHPWVVAGRLAALESSIKGSKNQKLAFELLKSTLPEHDWRYNHVIDGWQIDICSLKSNLYIEWDGRPHFLPVFGEANLRERQNRDRIKDKLITQKLKGALLRVKDPARYNPSFVKEKVDKIIELVQFNKIIPETVILL